ncbi:putative GTPase [Methanocella conradii HZ254]|uniref:GTPase n=1 Tax=Methanocella conradii (strain DSM 24694 / JCM 17849 / CGMCC 1.5162 / HZ254) TaxID=1041930 RepID=H8I574_METCZ|nr:GTP-binding protein [Methanocella conradii]AFC99271.1 putative GTPase [Methanocella conradii HZ254]
MFENPAHRAGPCDGDHRIKVVAFGSYHSGKTSFIRCIDPDPITTEVKSGNGTTTVAFDLAIKEHRGFRLYVYGTPGQERFDVAREVVSFGLHAGVVVVDSTRGMTNFEKLILSELRKHGIPCVVAANKQDLPGASLDKVRADAGGFCEVYPVSARTGEGVGTVLDRLVDLVAR